MNKYLKIGLITFAVIFVLGAIANSGDDKKTTTDKTTEEKPLAEKTDQATTDTVKEEIKEQIKPITITALELIKDFDKNQLSAEEKYSGKLVNTTGYIKNISEDIMGKPFLSINPSSDKYYFGTHIQCFFNSKSDLIDVENSQKITITGKVKTQTMGIIMVEDCKISK